MSDAKGQVPLQTAAEFERTYNAQAHEIVDAMTAAVTNAQAGLNWLRAEPPDLEEVRQVLNFIARDGGDKWPADVCFGPCSGLKSDTA